MMHKHSVILTAAAKVSSGKLRKRNTNTLSSREYFRLRTSPVRHRVISAFHCVKLLTVGRVAQLAEQCPFNRLLNYPSTAGQSLTSGLRHDERGKGMVGGIHCALNCALASRGFPFSPRLTLSSLCCPLFDALSGLAYNLIPHGSSWASASAGCTIPGKFHFRPPFGPT